MGCCWNSGNDSLGNHKGDRNFDRQSSIKPCKLYLVLVRLNNNKMVVTVVPLCTGNSVTWPGGEASEGEEESLGLWMDVLGL